MSLNNNQKWIIYSSSDITLTVNGNNLDASGAFTGFIRAAGVWEGGENAVGDVATLDAHSDSVPVGGTVSANVEGDTALLEFQWKVEGGGDLLMMALPHHQDLLTNSATAHKSKVLKGMMVGYTGSTWTLNTPLTTITWGAPRFCLQERMTLSDLLLQETLPMLAAVAMIPILGANRWLF